MKNLEKDLKNKKNREEEKRKKERNRRREKFKEESQARKLVGSERDARGERWKARRRKVRGAWIPSSRSRRRLEEESRWEEIGGRSGLAVHRLVHRPAGRSTSDTSHRRETLMQRARKCRPRCPLCVSATTISTRFSNFVSLRCVFRSIRNRLERLPIVLTVLTVRRSATGKSCPSIGWRRGKRITTLEICVRARESFLVRSTLDRLRFDRSVVLDRWLFLVFRVCSLWFRDPQIYRIYRIEFTFFYYMKKR